jgi:predicted nucleic acid-binding protein
MPDFYIGAHAVIQNMILLTRDTKQYHGYFPKLQLITPNSVK